MHTLPLVSKTECRKSLWRAIDAVNQLEELGIKFPADAGDLKKIEVEFTAAHKWRYGSYSWRGQVGAIYGIDIAQRNPGKAVANPNRFYVERKARYIIPCIAICDTHHRFIYYDIFARSSIAVALISLARRCAFITFASTGGSASS